MVPSATTLTAPSTRRRRASQEGGSRVLDVEQAEGRRLEGGERKRVDRHHRLTQQPNEGARVLHPDRRGEAEVGHRYVGETPGGGGFAFDRVQRAAVGRGREHGVVLGRAPWCGRAPAVDLDAGPHQDVLQLPAGHGRAERGLGARHGAAVGDGRVGPGVGLPHAEVQDDGGLELANRGAGPGRVPGVDAQETARVRSRRRGG